MSLAEVGFALKRIFLPRERASSVGGKLRFAAQRPRGRGDIERHSPPFRSRFAPQRLKYPLSLDAGRAQLGQADRGRRRRNLTSTLKKPGWKHDILGQLGFELRVFWPTRRTRRAPRNLLEFRHGHEAVRTQSSQVLCLSANVHFMHKVEKYMQNGQLLQWVTYKSNCRISGTPISRSQESFRAFISVHGGEIEIVRYRR